MGDSRRRFLFRKRTNFSQRLSALRNNNISISKRQPSIVTMSRTLPQTYDAEMDDEIGTEDVPPEVNDNESGNPGQALSRLVHNATEQNTSGLLSDEQILDLRFGLRKQVWRTTRPVAIKSSSSRKTPVSSRGLQRLGVRTLCDRRGMRSRTPTSDCGKS